MAPIHSPANAFASPRYRRVAFLAFLALLSTLALTLTGSSAGLSPPALVNSGATVTLGVYRLGSGNGTVTSSPAGIDCGSICAYNFDDGSSVTLTANPQSGSTFDGWTGGGCSGTGACTVTMTTTLYVGATFTSQTPTTPTTPTTTNPTGAGTGSPVQVCVVPNVKGKTLAAAKRKIAGAHCSVGAVTRKFHARVKKGCVISQAPAPGKHLAKGAKVNLVVSKGQTT